HRHHPQRGGRAVRLGRDGTARLRSQRPAQLRLLLDERAHGAGLRGSGQAGGLPQVPPLHHPEEAMKLWLEQVGELPARLSLADDTELAEDPVDGPFIRSLPYSHATCFVDEEGQRRVMVDAINRVLLEGTDPAT